MSVIIPNSREDFFLEKALRSLLAQTLVDFEVIVVSNGQAHGTAALRGWSDFVKLRVINVSERCSPSKARNIGIRQANSPVLAFLDDDDLYTASHLQSVVDLIENQITDVAYGGCIVATEWRVAREPLQTDHLYAMFAYHFVPELLLVGNYIPTSCVAVRNEPDVIFNEDKEVMEDWDLLLRLAFRSKKRFCYSGDISVVYHRVTDHSNLASSGRDWKHWQYLYEKHCTEWPSDNSAVIAGRAAVVDHMQLEQSRRSSDNVDPLPYEKLMHRLHTEWQR